MVYWPFSLLGVMMWFHQMIRHLKVSFTQFFMHAVTKSVLWKVKSSLTRTRHSDVKGTYITRPEFVPCVHRISHKLKNLAARYGAPVISPTPNRLASLCLYHKYWETRMHEEPCQALCVLCCGGYLCDTFQLWQVLCVSEGLVFERPY